MDVPGMITIPLKDYDQLLEEQAFLECLRAAGVDNWEGYEEALAIFNDEEL